MCSNKTNAMTKGSNEGLSNTFAHNQAKIGGAVHALDSRVTFHGNIIVFRNNCAQYGGALYNSGELNMKTRRVYFTSNRARDNGGAIFTRTGYLSLEHGTGYFSSNSAVQGGAIYFKFFGANRAGILIQGNSFFTHNYALTNGGAIFISSGNLTLSGSTKFSHNRAYYGGAIYLANSNPTLTGMITEFEGNSAHDGGGMYSEESQLITTNTRMVFTGNNARSRGGGLYILQGNQAVVSAHFLNNSAAKCGGAVNINRAMNVSFENIVVAENSGSGICVHGSTVKFGGISNLFRKNTGKFGGGIMTTSEKSILEFRGISEFEYNRALYGGAVYSLYETKLIFQDTTFFAHNTATINGGALYALRTEITINSGVTFRYNSAENGGALYLKISAFLNFGDFSNLYTFHNRASKYGGAIYHEDITIPTQCNILEIEQLGNTEIAGLPKCFIRIEHLFLIPRIDVTVYSHNDSAGREGSFMYGGLLGRCQLVQKGFMNYCRQDVVVYNLLKSNFFNITKFDNNTHGITSWPYLMCFCWNEDKLNCSGSKEIKIYRGQKFNLSLLAVDQMGASISTKITALVSSTARLELKQSSQILPGQCSNISYNLYSTKHQEHLILYPDGPCRDTGLARAIVNITFRPCPVGFNKSNEQCVCERRLQEYGAECTILEDISLTRKPGSIFWVSTLYDNETYQGLILYKTCPVEYCKIEISNISLDNPDVQCDLNRSGVLCGACAANHSLMIGSSRCGKCSNAYLALLLPFAAAGIALVVFLSILRLTVATGMINSVILYANVVQVNRKVFLLSNKRNILTVFIAWMNLDLGFETCFYNGMTAYAQTWLQFSFPIYIWILIILIILISRYSTILSKLIGHNPIAVLATLLLMSYTKILKIIVEVYSSVELDYPRSKTVPVWLKDANVDYKRSWHLFLTVVTSLILVFLFLPYTFLLLLGYKLYRFTHKKYFHWLNRLKPLLDSYYAPYKIHTRYWTGFLLLVRCALYIIFSSNHTNVSLLAITITFTAIVIIAWLSVRIYKRLLVNAVEASIYFNLITLSAATSNGLNSAALVYSLVGIVFVTTMGIIVYHFHILYTAKSALWLKIETTRSRLLASLKTPHDTALTPTDQPATTSSHDPHKIVTKTVLELREPLLEM